MPVDEIALALDILEVRVQTFDGFEGMLLTDTVRSRGVILANDRHGHHRARFTIGHELGHFLLERHRLSDERGFRCRAQDMREDGEELRSATPLSRQEAEANRFAIELLAPLRLVAGALREDPDLRVVRDLARALDLSLAATLRRYVDLHDQPLAAVWSKAGIVQTFARSERFPWLAVKKADALGPTSRACRVSVSNRSGTTDMRETQPLAWLGRSEVELFEQTRIGKDGHAVTLLWATLDEDEAENQGPAPAPWEREDPPFGPPGRS